MVKRLNFNDFTCSYYNEMADCYETIFAVSYVPVTEICCSYGHKKTVWRMGTEIII